MGGQAINCPEIGVVMELYRFNTQEIAILVKIDSKLLVR